jgi:hypothetical protein
VFAHVPRAPLTRPLVTSIVSYRNVLWPVADDADKKIKIWSTVPILDAEAEESEANPKLLCTMSSHTGQRKNWVCHGHIS